MLMLLLTITNRTINLPSNNFDFSMKPEINIFVNETIFVFDDIHCSNGMTKAWEEIKKHPKVTSTIDLFFLGIVFFNTDLSKEDFVLKF